MTLYTLDTLPTEIAEKRLCAYCMGYTEAYCCFDCSEYDGLMTVAQFMSVHELTDWSI